MVRNYWKPALLGVGLTMLLTPTLGVIPAQSQRHAARQTTSLSSGTVIPVKLDEGLNSKDARKGDSFTATITDTDDKDAYSMFPAGTKVEGVVRDARAKKDKQPGMLDLEFKRIVQPDGRSYPINGDPIGLDSKSVTRQNGRLVAKSGNKGPNRLTYVGIGAGAGLLVNVLTGRKGTLLDTLVGAGLGYGAGSLIKNGQETKDVSLKAGTKLGVRLDRSIALAR